VEGSSAGTPLAMCRPCEVHAPALHILELCLCIGTRVGVIYRGSQKCKSSRTGGEADKQGIGKHTVGAPCVIVKYGPLTQICIGKSSEVIQNCYLLSISSLTWTLLDGGLNGYSKKKYVCKVPLPTIAHLFRISTNSDSFCTYTYSAGTWISAISKRSISSQQPNTRKSRSVISRLPYSYTKTTSSYTLLLIVSGRICWITMS
jgi:hypothetical protein